MPTTQEESWRFTDLKGFDPDALVSNGRVPVTVTRTMLDLDVAGRATVTSAGVEIEGAPEGIRFEALDEAHERLAGSSGRTRSSLRTTRRSGSTASWSTCRAASS